ncbi:hypothetical protein RS130_13235 [Paraglaciecola aquimarina]|uniref:IclR-ED domain-containing protein n=1 Tax=Paraglaciecola aquimarina TaxID=1235557 RepID=A0ABU3SXL0_9ALTE|nr:hypothetical protein [Paraglaciecola aquimarina]MDU0354751.1 hypothetical protein [Paraglaciecola aquimarina]
MVAINKIREDGYAFIETLENERFTIAIPVGEPAFCAIGLSGWIPKHSVAEIYQELQKAAIEISDLTH